MIEYQGNEYQRFYHLTKHLFKSLDIEHYYIYEGKEIHQLQVFIEVPSLSLEEADKKLDIISDALKEKISQNWKCLPSIHVPKSYNIVTLPYKQYIP